MSHLRKAEIGLIIGVLLMAVARMAGFTVSLYTDTIGYVFFVFGCANYAIAKGYSGRLGALMGSLLVGFFVLLVLPRQSEDDAD